MWLQNSSVSLQSTCHLSQPTPADHPYLSVCGEAVVLAEDIGGSLVADGWSWGSSLLVLDVDAAPELPSAQDVADFDCGLATEVLLHMSSSDEDGSLWVEGLVSLAVSVCSLEECLNFLDFSDKEEILDKGLFRFKEEFLFNGKFGFMAKGEFFEEGDNFAFGDAEWPNVHAEPFNELLASDTGVGTSSRVG